MGKTGDYPLKSVLTGDEEITFKDGSATKRGPLSAVAQLAIDEIEASDVQSVNGATGVVVLDAGDVGADPAGTAATAVGVHSADTTGVHGIADTSLLLDTGDIGTTVEPVHTRRTLKAGELGSAAGSPSYSRLNKAGVWLLDPASDEGVSGLLDDLPSSWIGQSIGVHVLVSPNGVPGSTSVVIRAEHWASVVQNTAGGLNGTVTSLSSITQDMSTTASSQSLWVDLGTFTPTDSHWLRILRLAANVADTFASDLGIAAVRLTGP